jgi:general secretion pathway protein K
MRACIYKKQRRRGRAKERGAALIMVLLAIVVLTVFLTEVQQETATSYASALSARDRLRAEYHARSAINLTRLLISLEPTVRKAIEPMFMLINQGRGRAPQIQVWEFSDQVLGAFNDSEGAEGFAALAGVDASAGENLGLGGTGRFDVVVVDEDSKINVNTAARGDTISAMRVASQLLGLMSGPQYDPLFAKLDADGQVIDRQTVCRAIIDWADYNQDVEPCDLAAQASSAGAEDNFYQSIGLGYFRKNAAFDSLEELRLVRGIGDDFWSTFIDPDPQNPRKRAVTVWGSGEINVNSANAQTLYAFVCSNAQDAQMCPGSADFDPLQAAAFIQTVTLFRSFTNGAPIFGSSRDFINAMKGTGMLGPYLAMMGMQPVTFKSDNEVRQMATTQSKLFSIYAEGVVPDPLKRRETRVSIHAVVDYRNAMALDELASEVDTGAGAQGGQPAPPPASVDPNDAAAAALQELNSNPAGNIVYWRIQ